MNKNLIKESFLKILYLKSKISEIKGTVLFESKVLQ